MNQISDEAKTNQEARQRLIDEIHLLLGGGIIDIELDPEHYNEAINNSFERYRQRSSNAVEESYIFMELQPDQNVYFLPTEIVEVRNLYRRGVSGGVTGGAFIDPFSLAYTNAYLLNLSSGSMGGLATYDFYMQYQELLGRMFGRDINFAWEPALHKLTIMRRPVAKEQILLWTYNYKPDFVLLADPYAKAWLRDYAHAKAKYIVGEARSKFANIPGPQGGSSLNGNEMKTEAQAKMDALDLELATQMEQRMGYGFIIG
jgi:hypothetical protein